jgi:hypothetical protein
MMSFNVTWFGYGCGLVLCGWLAGMIVSVVLGIVGKMGKLGLVLVVGAGIWLGSLDPAEAVVLSVNGATDGGVSGPAVCTVTVSSGVGNPCVGQLLGGGPGGGVPFAVSGAVGSGTFQVECMGDNAGITTIEVNGDDNLSSAVVVGPCSPGTDTGKLVSFLAGVGCVLAFSWAAVGRWFL